MPQAEQVKSDDLFRNKMKHKDHRECRHVWVKTKLSVQPRQINAAGAKVQKQNVKTNRRTQKTARTKAHHAKTAGGTWSR